MDESLTPEIGADVPTFQADLAPAREMPRCALGEGATWSPARGALLWTDINGCRLWSYEPASGRVTHWTLPWRLGSFALTDDPDRLLAAFEHHLAWLNLRSGDTDSLVRFEEGLLTRANDGRCDRQGRFVFGTFDEVRGTQAQGSWWRYTQGDGLHKLDLPPVYIANGLGFSPDGRRMYFCDSQEQRLRVANYEPATGRIEHPQVFAPVHVGEPDGATVDAEGRYWSAHWGASAVVCYAPDGQVLARVNLTVSQPSCVALGGPDLKTLYITTARVGLAPHRLAEEPNAGALFQVELPWAGLPEPVFGTGA